MAADSARFKKTSNCFIGALGLVISEHGIVKGVQKTNLNFLSCL